ncbi:MAG: hypothetical protein RL077_919, partial [Verrucomicrobiota bacterium]
PGSRGDKSVAHPTDRRHSCRRWWPRRRASLPHHPPSRAPMKQLLQVVGGKRKLFLPVGAKTCFGGWAPRSPRPKSDFCRDRKNQRQHCAPTLNEWGFFGILKNAGSLTPSGPEVCIRASFPPRCLPPKTVSRASICTRNPLFHPRPFRAPRPQPHPNPPPSQNRLIYPSFIPIPPCPSP